VLLEDSGRLDKRREAPGKTHKRLFYCVNVNRTSLDHLLLGESADIDRLSNAPSITPDDREASCGLGLAEEVGADGQYKDPQIRVSRICR
jgi:hypothetical protein